VGSDCAEPSQACQAGRPAVTDGEGIIGDRSFLDDAGRIGRSINERGVVAGESTFGRGSATRAFRFTEADGMVSLGTLAGGFNSSSLSLLKNETNHLPGLVWNLFGAGSKYALPPRRLFLFRHRQGRFRFCPPLLNCYYPIRRPCELCLFHGISYPSAACPHEQTLHGHMVPIVEILIQAFLKALARVFALKQP
jgi:probable HAF family extracellular repeat protein